jgi:hypothetical protein
MPRKLTLQSAKLGMLQDVVQRGPREVPRVWILDSSALFTERLPRKFTGT